MYAEVLHLRTGGAEVKLLTMYQQFDVYSNWSPKIETTELERIIYKLETKWLKLTRRVTEEGQYKLPL